jgi:hypothetical protein
MTGLLVAAVMLFVACSGSAWAFPSPAPLPPGAIAVPIDVQPIPSARADVEFGCPAALLSPVELVVDRSVQPPKVSYRSVDSGDPIGIAWSWGVSAYEWAGIVHIVAPDGADLLVEGVVADDIGGGYMGNEDVFGACDVRSLPRRL